MSELLDNIKHIIQKSMKENNIPGAAVAVIQNHEIILSEGFGRTTVEEWGSPIRKDTLFRIASVSKLFTGTVIMMLVEKGHIDLDEPVQSYVPWFTTADPELSKLMTIRMLLSHSSGLPTGGALSFHYKENGLYHYMKEVVPTLPVLFYPGTAYSYGNHGLNIAGFVAEQVTKKSFAELMQEMLFDPLGMTQTTYHPLKAMTFPFAMPHERSEDGMAVSHQFFDNSASYPSYYAFSSIEDLSRFALMQLKNGVFNNKQILSSSSVSEMRTQQSKWYTPTDAGCGITFFRETKNGTERFWHYGQYSHQYSSQFILVPEKGLAVIALANGENIFQAGYEIVDEMLKELKTEAASEITPISKQPDWNYYNGSFLHSYYGLFHLDCTSERAFIEHNEQSFELTPFNEDTYFAKDPQGETRFTIGFPQITEEQTIKTIMVNSQACPEFNGTYTPNPEEWNCWKGIYSDGRESYEVRIDEDFLIITDLQSGRDLEGQAIAKNLFLTREFGLVDFIEIAGVVTLEFGYAWRFQKKSEL
jgi:CubicO group peptidase (beta-lactamase class C family)